MSNSNWKIVVEIAEKQLFQAECERQDLKESDVLRGFVYRYLRHPESFREIGRAVPKSDDSALNVRIDDAAKKMFLELAASNGTSGRAVILSGLREFLNGADEALADYLDMVEQSDYEELDRIAARLRDRGVI